MNEIDQLISGNLVGADVSASDLALARALINGGGVSGEVDIVGDDPFEVAGEVDIVGLDDDVAGDDEVGARRRRGKGVKRVSAQQLKNAAAAMAVRMAGQMTQRGGGLVPGLSAPNVVERDASNAGTETAFLSVFRDATNGVLIPAGADAEVIGEPQKPFRPEALVIDDDSARDFLILDIKIGTDSLMVNNGPIPATGFTGEAVLNALRTRTGQTSQQISIRVRNRSADARPFYATFKGSKLR